VAGNRWTRSSAASSRSALAALAVVGAVALAGCAAGQQAQTAEQRPTVDGTNIELGALAIRDVALEYPEEGVYEKGSDARLRMVVVNEGDSGDALIEVRSDVAEKVTITAAGEDAAGPTPTVTAPPPSPSQSSSETGLPNASSENPSPSVTGTGTAVPSSSASGTPSATPTPTPSAGAEPEAARIPIPTNGLVAFFDEGPTVLLSGLTEQLRPGQIISITLVFQGAGEITTDVAVSTPREEIELAPTVPGEEGREQGEGETGG
jgi:copper(I)-binding protein